MLFQQVVKVFWRDLVFVAGIKVAALLQHLFCAKKFFHKKIAKGVGL
jgi:hypothetical protein